MTQLDRYVAIAAFRNFILAVTALTALFSLLAFVEELSSVGQGHYGLLDALLYILLTIPYRLLQVAPVSMLLGCLFALGAFAGSSELTAMRALGMSERRIIGSVLALACPIIVTLFLIAEFVIPTTQQMAEVQRSSKLSSSAPLLGGDSFWAQGDHQYLNVERFEFGNVPRNIDIYTFTPDGNLTSFVHADRADIRPNGIWLLTDVLRKRISFSQFTTDHLASYSWRSFLPPNQAQQLMLPPENMAPVELYLYIRDLGRRHQEATRYVEELWEKISIPFSMLAMIVIAAPFVFGPARAQSTGQQIMIGASFGIVFTLTQQISSHLDLLLNLNPAVTALAPSLLLMALAVYLFRRQHRPRIGRLTLSHPDDPETLHNESVAGKEEQPESR